MLAAVFCTLQTLANHLKHSMWLTAQGSCSMLTAAVQAYAVYAIYAKQHAMASTVARPCNRWHADQV